MNRKPFGTAFLLFVFIILPVFSNPYKSTSNEPENLILFKKAYPDVQFKSQFDEKQKDFLISISCENRTADFYWQNGSLLPPQDLQNAQNYWTLLYSYADKIPDPKDFTEEDIERIRNFSSKENRTNGAKTPPFFYDLIYDCKTRAALETHIIKHTFLGKTTRIHERIKEPLLRVEKKILDEAKINPEVQTFIDTCEDSGGKAVMQLKYENQDKSLPLNGYVCICKNQQCATGATCNEAGECESNACADGLSTICENDDNHAGFTYECEDGKIKYSTKKACKDKDNKSISCNEIGTDCGECLNGFSA